MEIPFVFQCLFLGFWASWQGTRLMHDTQEFKNHQGVNGRCNPCRGSGSLARCACVLGIVSALEYATRVFTGELQWNMELWVQLPFFHDHLLIAVVVTIFSAFTSLSTLASIGQQIHFAISWETIHQAEYESAVEGLKRARIVYGNAVVIVDSVLYYIRKSNYSWLSEFHS